MGELELIASQTKQRNLVRKNKLSLTGESDNHVLCHTEQLKTNPQTIIILNWILSDFAHYLSLLFSDNFQNSIEDSIRTVNKEQFGEPEIRKADNGNRSLEAALTRLADSIEQSNTPVVRTDWMRLAQFVDKAMAIAYILIYLITLVYLVIALSYRKIEWPI